MVGFFDQHTQDEIHGFNPIDYFGTTDKISLKTDRIRGGTIIPGNEYGTHRIKCNQGEVIIRIIRGSPKDSPMEGI